jgi:hypothetical protein
MGKMPDPRGDSVWGSNHGWFQASLEFCQLVFGQDVERALQDDNGFAETGIQVIVSRFQKAKSDPAGGLKPLPELPRRKHKFCANSSTIPAKANILCRNRDRPVGRTRQKRPS